MQRTWFSSSIPVEPSNLIKDIKAAKKNIVLSISDLSKLNKDLWKLIQEMSKKIEVKIYTVDDVNTTSSIQIVPKNLFGSFIIIYDAFLWVGAPIIVGSKYESEPKPPFFSKITCT